MQKNDICRVITDRDGTHTHPIGTIVKVVMVGNRDRDPEPYFCQTTEGKSCYWYGEQDLEVIEREGLI